MTDTSDSSDPKMESLIKCILCGQEFYDLPSSSSSSLVSGNLELYNIVCKFGPVLNINSEIDAEENCEFCEKCKNLLLQIISARDALTTCVHNLLSTSASGKQFTDIERNRIIGRLFGDEDSISRRKLACSSDTESKYLKKKDSNVSASSPYLLPVVGSPNLLNCNASNLLDDSATFSVDNQKALQVQIKHEVNHNLDVLTLPTAREDFSHNENSSIIVTLDVDLQNGIYLDSTGSKSNGVHLNKETKIDKAIESNQFSICEAENEINFASKTKNNDEVSVVPGPGLVSGDNILSNISNENERTNILNSVLAEDSMGLEISTEALKPKKKIRKLHTCTVCSRICKTVRDLEVHMGVHLQERKFICEICGLAYRHKKALEVHVALHRGEAKFECEHCHKVFTQKSGLQRHLPIHTGEKAYQCDICGKQFLYKTSFNVHKFTHTKRKEFECFQCGLSFFSTSHLKRHMKTHTGIKPHACKCCGNRFSERYNLDAHMRIHTGRKSHQCPHCELGFNRKGKMEEHMIQVHAHPAVRVLALESNSSQLIL